MEILRLLLFFRRYSIQYDANKIDATIIAYMITSFTIKYSYECCLNGFYFYMKKYQEVKISFFFEKKTITKKMRMSQEFIEKQ